MAKYIAQMYGFYRTEAECYRQASTVGLGVPTPVVYFSEVSDDDTGTLILMEDLSDARMADQVAGADLADAQAVMDVGAQLHAAWWESDRLAELTWLRPLNNPAYMAVGDQYATSWPIFAEMFASAPTAALEVGERIAAQLPSSYDWLMANRPTTLVHTDFRLDNFFFGRSAAPVTVIDWQLTVRSVGAFDIGYFIVQSLTTEMRRQHGEGLLRRWHQGLIDRGVSDYSWDDAGGRLPRLGDAADVDPGHRRGQSRPSQRTREAPSRLPGSSQLPGVGRLRLQWAPYRLSHPNNGSHVAHRARVRYSSLRSGSRTSRCNRSGEMAVRGSGRANHLGGVAAGRVHH